MIIISSIKPARSASNHEFKSNENINQRELLLGNKIKKREKMTKLTRLQKTIYVLWLGLRGIKGVLIIKHSQ